MNGDLSSLDPNTAATLLAQQLATSGTAPLLPPTQQQPAPVPMATQQQPTPPQGATTPAGPVPLNIDQDAINRIIRNITNPGATASWGTSPLFQGMLGLAQGFGQASVPTPYRMPFGAVLGMGAGGLAQGLSRAASNQGTVAQAQGEQLKNAMTLAGLPLSLQRLQYSTDIMRKAMTPEGRASMGMPDVDFSNLTQPTTGTVTSATPATVAPGTTVDTSKIQPASGWSMYDALPPEKQKLVDTAVAQTGINRDILANHLYNESRLAMSVPPGDTQPGTPGGPSYGLMQMKEGTLATYNAMHGTKWTIDDLQRDPQLAVNVGAGYWMDLYNQNNKNPFIASMAYARGPGATQGWVKGGADFSQLPPTTRQVLGNIYGPGSFPGATPIPEALSFNARRNQGNQPNVAPTGYRTASTTDVAPPANANLTPPAPSPAATANANAIAAGMDQARTGAGTAVAQNVPPAAPAASTAPPAAQQPNIPGAGPQAMALPEGVLLDPKMALAQAQRLNRAAMLGDITGVPIFGDPQTLREQAKIFLQYGLAPSQKAYEAAIEANTKLRYAAPTAYAARTGELTAEASPAGQAANLSKLGFVLNPDGSASAIKGGPADIDYVGAKKAAEARAEAEAQLATAKGMATARAYGDLLGKGYTVSADGKGLSYIPNGPSDPKQVGDLESAKALAQAGAEILKAGPIAQAQLIQRHPTITFKTTGNDGYMHEYTVPTQQWLDATNKGTPLGPNLPGAVEGPPIYTQEQTERSTGLGKTSDEIQAAGVNAPKGLIQLANLDNARQYFRPGSTAELRKEGFKMATDILGVQNVPSWMSQGAAGAETIDKEGTFLASAMTKALGSREAYSVFQAIQKIQPNIQMSEGGFDVIMNAMRVGLQRDQDLYRFQNTWLQDPRHHGSIGAGPGQEAMLDAFERTHPVEAYASRVIPMEAQRGGQMLGKDQLIPNVIYRVPNGQGGFDQRVWDGRQFSDPVTPPSTSVNVGTYRTAPPVTTPPPTIMPYQ